MRWIVPCAVVLALGGAGCAHAPRPDRPGAVEAEGLPKPNDQLVARIVSLDGTWHRPFTTLELAALQSIFDPGEVFDLAGGSDQMKREWIGNAVPSAAARGSFGYSTLSSNANRASQTSRAASPGETWRLPATTSTARRASGDALSRSVIRPRASSGSSSRTPTLALLRNSSRMADIVCVGVW